MIDACFVDGFAEIIIKACGFSVQNKRAVCICDRLNVICTVKMSDCKSSWNMTHVTRKVGV